MLHQTIDILIEIICTQASHLSCHVFINLFDDLITQNPIYCHLLEPAQIFNPTRTRRVLSTNISRCNWPKPFLNK